MAGAEKKARREGREIVFIDESGLSEQPTRVRTWAPKGRTPIINFHFNWSHASAIAALTRTCVMFRLHEGSIKKDEIVQFLTALKAQIGQPLLVIWDGLKSHRSELARLTQIDYEREMAIVAVTPGPGGAQETLGVVRAVTDPDNIDAEFGIIVRSDLKVMGLGRLLMRKLIRTLREHGTERLVATVLTENHRMLELAQGLGFVLGQPSLTDETREISISPENQRG